MVVGTKTSIDLYFDERIDLKGYLVSRDEALQALTAAGYTCAMVEYEVLSAAPVSDEAAATWDPEHLGYRSLADHVLAEVAGTHSS